MNDNIYLCQNACERTAAKQTGKILVGAVSASSSSVPSTGGVALTAVVASSTTVPTNDAPPAASTTTAAEPAAVVEPLPPSSGEPTPDVHRIAVVVPAPGESTPAAHTTAVVVPVPVVGPTPAAQTAVDLTAPASGLVATVAAQTAVESAAVENVYHRLEVNKRLLSMLSYTTHNNNVICYCQGLSNMTFALGSVQHAMHLKIIEIIASEANKQKDFNGRLERELSFSQYVNPLAILCVEVYQLSIPQLLSPEVQNLSTAGGHVSDRDYKKLIFGSRISKAGLSGFVKGFVDAFVSKYF